MKTFLTLILIVSFFVTPLATIASLNQLFALSIPYTLESWLASFWVGVLLMGGLATKRIS